MTNKMSPNDRSLQRRVDEVLHFLWDTIGVAGILQARDEYDRYAWRVFKMVRNESSVDEIADYLVSVERDWMSIGPRPASAREIAKSLLDDWVWIRDVRASH